MKRDRPSSSNLTAEIGETPLDVPVLMEFDRGSHTADAIQRAAYKFSQSFAIELRAVEDAYLCHLYTRGTALSVDILNDFRIEVIDCVLRERIRQSTEGIRNLVFAVAFSKLQNPADE